MATYTVKGGDTVSQILKNLGVSSYGSRSTWDAVRSANKLDSRYTIYPNQKLVIPDTLLGKTSSTSTTAPTATKTTAPAPEITDQEQMTEYLNEYQEQLNALEDYDPFEEVGSIEDVIDKLGMEGEAPIAPKYEETFQKLRLDMGLDTVEAGINEYKQMIREEENLLMQQRGYERSKTNRLGVIEGRIDKATQDRQEQISWLSSNVSYLTDVANSAYNYISMTMNFKQMDYQTAKEAYDSEFTKRMAVYDSIIQQGQDDRDFRLNLIQEQQRVASAQLTMYADMITTGQIAWSELSKDEQTAIYKLEVQAGLPVGFTGRLQIPKGSTIQSITNRRDASGRMVADIIYVDPRTGKVSVEHKDLGSVYVAPKSSGTSSTKLSEGEVTSAFIKNATTKGTKEYNQTMSALSKYGSPVKGITGAFRITNEQQAYSAVSYLSSVANVPDDAAYFAVEQVMKSLGMRIN